MIDELLRASNVSIRHRATSVHVRALLLVVAHRRQTLVCDAAQMIARLVVETHVVFLGRLDQLRLVHDLPDLFLQQAVRHGV